MKHGLATDVSNGFVGRRVLSNPIVGTIDRLNDLPPTRLGDVSAFIFQLRFGNCPEQIAFAERRPI
jgi:hypothetical protein